MTFRHTVGKGPIGAAGSTQVYDKAKQGYLFWGLIPLQRQHTKQPVHGDYQVKTCFNFEDGLATILSAGIVSFRSIKILEYKQDRIDGFDFRVGDKIAHQYKNEPTIGEIVGIDAQRNNISYQYLNIYGEKRVRSVKPRQLQSLSEQNYRQRLREWNKEIDRYKYKVGEYAIWPLNNSTEFGVISQLDDQRHLATIELTNIYNETVYFKVHYLDIEIIDSYDYQERLDDWEAVKSDYIFELDDRVRWEYARDKYRTATVVAESNSNHQVALLYTDDKGEQKTSRVNVLKLSKQFNL